MTTDKRGISALLLQRQLELRRYETAWMMLHKLRRAMVNVAREPLRGEVEIDEAWIGGPQAGLRGSRQLKGRRAALVLVAVEKRGKASGRSGFDDLHRCSEEFHGFGQSWVSAHRPGAAEDNRIAQGSQIGSALGRPCYR